MAAASRPRQDVAASGRVGTVVGRIAGTADGQPTSIGTIPTRESLQLDGLSLSDRDIDLLLDVDGETWKGEANSIRAYFAFLGDSVRAG